MRNVLQALHMLTAIFAVGPFAHAATTAAKSLRVGSPERARESARLTRLYAVASVLAVIFGFSLMSQKGRTGQPLGQISDLWIWGSSVLWLACVGLAFGVVAPSLEKAAAAMESGADAASLRGRVAGAGGVIGLLLAAIVALMVFKP